MIENLILDISANISNLMIVGIYRSNEVDAETHMLSKTIRDMKSGCVAADQSNNAYEVTEIHIGDLHCNSIQRFLRDLLSMDYFSDDSDEDENGAAMGPVSNRQKLAELSELCFRKTSGNPFHLKHFLSMIEERNLLSYNLGVMEWKWDIAEIESVVTATDNVVDLLRNKMANLVNPDTIQVLQLAAFLGSTFDAKTLHTVWKVYRMEHAGHQEGQEQLDTHDLGRSVLDRLLAECQSNGFIEATGIGDSDTLSESIEGEMQQETYCWVHDNIQEAALSLISSKAELSTLKREVGEILLAELSSKDLEASIFVVANLLNQEQDSEGQILVGSN